MADETKATAEITEITSVSYTGDDGQIPDERLPFEAHGVPPDAAAAQAVGITAEPADLMPGEANFPDILQQEDDSCEASVPSEAAGPALDNGQSAERVKAKSSSAKHYESFLICSGGLFRTKDGEYGGPGRPNIAIYANESLAMLARSGTDCIVSSALYDLDTRKPNVG